MSPPYNFLVALRALWAGAALSLVVSAALLLVASGRLAMSSPRFYFFAYLAIGFIGALAFSQKKALSLCLLVVCTADFGVAVGSASLSTLGVGVNLVPPNAWPDDRFVYHPLLQGVPKPNFVSDDGQIRVVHNSEGWRGENVPDLQSRHLVIAYGGSTTYDVGVDQGYTWTEQLEQALGDDFVVLNFGVPGYSTVENIVQTAFYSVVGGRSADCALYYLGWNDIRSAHVLGLDNAYAGFHLLGQPDTLQVRSARIAYSEVSPLGHYAATRLQSLLDIAGRPRRILAAPTAAGSDADLEEIFQRNVATLSAINRARGVKSLFVGQLLNRSVLTSDETSGWVPLVADVDLWPLQQRFNEILREQADALGDRYIDVDVDAFDEPDFVDRGHFSRAGASKFAELIADMVRTDCQ